MRFLNGGNYGQHHLLTQTVRFCVRCDRVKTAMNGTVLKIINVFTVTSVVIIAMRIAVFVSFLNEKRTAEVKKIVQFHFINASDQLPVRRSLYVCGWDVGFESWVSHVFSDFEQKGILREGHEKNFTQDDVLIFGMRGPCPVHRDWILQHFQGKIAYVNGEGFGPYYAKGREYVLGNIGSKENNHSFYFPYGFAVTLWKYPEQMIHICDPTQKAKGTKKKFLIYTNSQCINFREKVFRELSSIGKVEFGGKCDGGAGVEGNKSNRIKASMQNITRKERNLNPSFYREYRFCLVMENKNAPGYVSEKIVFAYLGGCIPIYYGDKETIFDIFNPKSFIFHNVNKINSTQILLERISELESNPDRYEGMANQPILAQGNSSIRKYLSIYHEYGGGHLKSALRHMLGISKIGS